MLAPLCFFAVMSLAGPHGGILPGSLHGLVFVVAWALLVGGPVLVASIVRRRLALGRHAVSPTHRDGAEPIC